MNLNFTIPDELHKKLKIKALKKNMHLKEYIEEVLKEEVKND